jgi:hypothetical protein
VVKHLEKEKGESARAKTMWKSLAGKFAGKGKKGASGEDGIAKVMTQWTKKATAFLEFGATVSVQ